MYSKADARSKRIGFFILPYKELLMYFMPFLFGLARKHKPLDFKPLLRFVRTF
jgi:hypothetical protein